MTIDESGQRPEALTKRLAKGEKLIWWDRPSPAGLAKRELNYSTFSGVFMFFFAIFWMTMAYRAPGPFFLFGLLFIGIGLWLATRPLRAYWSGPSTLYALTDKRALIVKNNNTSGYPLERVDFVETESDASGRGQVLFFNESASPFAFGNYGGQMMRKSGFIAIPDSERVGNEMLQLMERRRAPGTAGAGAP